MNPKVNGLVRHFLVADFQAFYFPGETWILFNKSPLFIKITVRLYFFFEQVIYDFILKIYRKKSPV